MGIALGLALAAVLAAGAGALVIAGATSPGGSSFANCAGMHAAYVMGHTQCAAESRMGSPEACDATGMPEVQCAGMESYMGGPGMMSFCH